MTGRSARTNGGAFPILPRIAVAAVVCVALLALGTAAVSASEPRRVLLLHPYGHPYPPMSEVAASFRAELVQRSPEPIDLYEVSLDADRAQDRQNEGPYVEYIRALLSGREPDLIVADSAPAAFFMQRHRATLFPATPMLILGADVRRIPSTDLAGNDTAILVKQDLAVYIENILRLRPGTREIAIVSGNSALERFWTAEYQREFQRFVSRVHFTYFTDLTFAEILKRAAAMPPRSAILWGSLFQDAAGVPYDEDRALSAMREVANAPIFPLGDYEVGRGSVGGPVLHTQAIGREGATLAVRILKGGRAGDIKPVLVGTEPPIYDWRELQRWNIPESLLPPNSVVQFRGRGIWQQYRWQILSAISLMLLEAALILALLYERRRRRRAEVEAHARLSELAHMNRRSAVGELSASITHELQQPLTAILFNTEAAELLLSRTPNPSDLRDILADIKRDDIRASEVIKRVRGLLAKAPAETQEVNLNEVVSEVFELLFAQSTARGVTLSTDLAPRPLRVRGDRIQLQQVVLNLVMNGLDAITSAKSAERRITGHTALVDDRYVQVSIEDSGPGVPPGKTEQIFEPFFTTKEGGMGMGLSITRTIVENHGGRIEAHNERGGGAIFRFTLSLLQPAARIGEKISTGDNAPLPTGTRDAAA